MRETTAAHVLPTMESRRPGVEPVRPRALMLTPDEGHLDRRIAQEAASLSRVGWAVDIVPTVDPALGFEGSLAAGVQLLSSSLRRPEPSRLRLGLRRLRSAIAPAAPAVDHFVEAVRYRLSDRARAMADANMSRLAAMGPYDLVVAHDVPVMPLAERLARRWRRPLVCDLHEVFPEQDEHFTTRTARSYWRSIEAAGLAAADGIICVNDAVADYVRTTHSPAAGIGVVHNSVPYVARDDLDGPTLRSYYDLPDGARVMVFAGTLRPHANIELLVEGFGTANLDRWVLAILGEGALRDSLEARVRRRGLGGRVFLGRRAPERDLLALVASADVGLLPYQPVGFNHLIATPNKLFEYIQARVPIATSRLPMIERIIGANGNGDFVDFSSVESIAAGLRRFVEESLGRITPAALEAAARQFSWETEESAFLAMVERVTRRPLR